MNEISANRPIQVLLIAGLFLAPILAASDTAAQVPGAAEIERDDSMRRFRLARLLGQTARYDEALAKFNELLSEHPDNVDFVFSRAQIFSWQLNDEEALPELERARKLAPDYEAVWRLQYQVLARREDAFENSELTTLRRQAALKFPEAEWWRDQGTRKVTRWQLTIGGALESLSNDLPAWDNQFLQLGWKPAGNLRVYGRIGRDSRFNNSDQQLAAGGERSFRDSWTAGLELTAATGADFLPVRGFSLHGGRRFTSGWGGDVRWQRRQYATATVSIYSVTAERYFGNYRAAYSLHNSHLHGADNSVSHSLAFDWFVTDGYSLRVSFADGEEAESVGFRQILRTDINNFTLSGRHALLRRLTLAWWTGSHRQGLLYRRKYAGLALIFGL